MSFYRDNSKMKDMFRKIGLYASGLVLATNLFAGTPAHYKSNPIKTEKINFKEFISKKGFKNVKQASLEDGVMYFQRGVGSKADIYSYNFKNKSLINLTADNLKGFDGSFDIYKDKIYFVRGTKKNKGDIYCMDLGSKNLTRLTNEGLDKDLSLSKDGTKLLYIHEGDKSDDIFELDLKTGKSKQITKTPNVDEKNPRYLNDGEKIAYLLDDSELPIQIKDIKTGKLEKIIIKRGYDDEYLSLEPTDKEVLYQHLTSSGRIRLEGKDLNNLKDIKIKSKVYSGSFWEVSKLQIADNGYFAYLGQADESLRLVFGQQDILRTSSKMLRDFNLDNTSFIITEDGSKVYVFSGEKMKVIENPLIKK